MKKYILMLVAALTAMACSNDTDIIDTPENMQEVTFTFSPYTMTPMHETRATTRAASEITTMSHLDVFIVNGSDVITVNQVNTDTGYGTLTVKLNKTKTYNVYAVAHNSSAAATLSSNTISFPDDIITETYFYSNTITPSKTTLSCEMSLVVAKFSLWITDAIPEGVNKIKITASESGKKLTTSGTATDTAVREKEFTSWTSSESGTLFSMYLIPTSTTTTQMSFTITAYNGNDVVEEKTFDDVDVRMGYKSMYKGQFFTSVDNPFTFTLSEWNSFDTVEF